MAAWQQPACSSPKLNNWLSGASPSTSLTGVTHGLADRCQPFGPGPHQGLQNWGEGPCLYLLCRLVLKQKHLLSSYLQRQMLLTAFSVFRASTQPSSLMVHRASSLQPPSPQMQTATRKIPGGGKDSSTQSHQTQVVSLLRCNRN